MTLEAFLALNNLRPSKLAAEIDVPASSISRLLNGSRPSPSLELMVKIMLGTSGQVTPNDFAHAYIEKMGRLGGEGGTQ